MAAVVRVMIIGRTRIFFPHKPGILSWRHMFLAVLCVVMSFGGTVLSEPQEETFKLSSPDGEAFDYFGYSVDIDGDRALIGVRYDDNVDGESAGSAYIFSFNGAEWIPGEKLIGDGTPNTQGEFGWDVALGSGFAVVSNPQCRGSFCKDDFFRDNGQVFVYRYEDDDWIEDAVLTASDREPYDYFGSSVAIDGDVIVVGASHEDPHGLNLAGSAYVFHLEGAVWEEQKKLVPLDLKEQSNFGNAVAVSGDTIIVGAYMADDFDCSSGGTGCNSGSAYIFSRHKGGPDNWGLAAKLHSSDIRSEDTFGASVSIDGDIAVVGAPQAGDFNGAAYVFSRHHGGTDAWGEVARLAASDNEVGDNFGNRAAVDGNVIIVGAIGKKTAGSWSGAAYEFRFQGGQWRETGKLIASDAKWNDRLSVSVSISGNKALLEFIAPVGRV